MVVGYTFDLRTNELTPELSPNPSAGKKHRFAAYRLTGMGSGVVSMQSVDEVERQVPSGDAE